MRLGLLIFKILNFYLSDLLTIMPHLTLSRLFMSRICLIIIMAHNKHGTQQTGVDYYGAHS